MRFVQTVAGDDPDFSIGDKHGINGYFYPMFDSLTTPERLADTRARGYNIGVFMATNWPRFVGRPPWEIAELVSEEYRKLTTKPGVVVSGLRVQFDMEEHDRAKILMVLEEWRWRRPTVGTSWTFEPMQGGWMGSRCPEPPSGFVKEILAAKVRLVPQLYGGAMQPFNEGRVVEDITSRGFPVGLVSPYYDAASYPAWADGFFFTAGRLAP